MTDVLVQPTRTRAFLSDWQRSLDWPLLTACTLLIGVGLLMSLAASPAAASRLGYEDTLYFFKRHLVFAGAGVLILFCSSLFDRVWARRVAALAFVLAVILMVVIVFAGYEAKGAQRWIRLAGLSLQPSEFVKPALIVLSAWLLAQRHAYPSGHWAGLTLVLFCMTLGLLLLQPDVGQSALLTAAFVITFYVSGLPFRIAAAFGGGGLVLSGILYALLPHVRYRINSFINPNAYDTYQIDKASEAIARGGFFGVGPGEGQIKTALPDAHTDFIYAVLCEEFGFIAAALLVMVFGFITWRGLKHAARMHDPYPRAAATGLFALFGLQAAINIAVNVSLIPPKGMTLPFVSYGGSSMLGTALTLGLALALTRRSSPAWRDI